jgi:hypothetical protein
MHGEFAGEKLPAVNVLARITGIAAIGAEVQKPVDSGG